MSKVSNTLLLVISSGVLATGAQAQNAIVASFTYDSLSGSYTQATPISGTFNASATAGGALNTVGDFNRLLPAFQNAAFPAGFVSDANVANISMSVSVTITGVNTAIGMGNLVITDVDGDQFTTGLNGIWTRTAVGVNFNATMVNPTFVDNGPADGAFNGYNGGWSTNFGTTNLTGASVSLVLSTTGFFNASYSDRPVGVSGQILPSPGAVGLALVGAAVAGRRRR
jgi:hypothetical protein